MSLHTRALQPVAQDLELFRRLFAANGYPRPPEYLRWLYGERPELPWYADLSLDPERATDDGLPHPAAVYASLPARFKLGDAERPGLQSLDTMTDEHYRGQGLFNRLAKSVYARAETEGVPLVYGFPNANSHRGFIDKLGWTDLDPVPFLIRPLRSGYFLRRLPLLRSLPRVRPFDWSLDWPLPVLGAARGLKSFECSASADFAKHETDALWQRFAAQLPVTLVRDHAYLDWRYRRKPGCDYRYLLARRDGHLCGLLVYCALEKHGGRIGYVMELMVDPDHPKLAAAMLASVLKTLGKERCDAVLAWNFAHSPTHRAYRGNGFVAMPERLRPIELHFGARAFDPALDGLLGERRNWYLSYSDSDTV